MICKRTRLFLSIKKYSSITEMGIPPSTQINLQPPTLGKLSQIPSSSKLQVFNRMNYIRTIGVLCTNFILNFKSFKKPTSLRNKYNNLYQAFEKTLSQSLHNQASNEFNIFKDSQSFLPKCYNMINRFLIKCLITSFPKHFCVTLFIANYC